MGGSPFPLNKNLKLASNALQSLQISMPLQTAATKLSAPRTSDTSSSSLPSFHPTDVNYDEYDHILPLVHRYQPAQSAQRYIVYYPQQNVSNELFVVDNNCRQSNYFISDECKYTANQQMERRRH